MLSPDSIEDRNNYCHQWQYCLNLQWLVFLLICFSSHFPVEYEKNWPGLKKIIIVFRDCEVEFEQLLLNEVELYEQSNIFFKKMKQLLANYLDSQY